jgi:hypothetical protein
MSKMTKNTPPNHETDLNRLVKIEFESINGKPFYGQATDDELLYIWVTVFKRKKDELFGVISNKTLNRNVRATYKLKGPIKLQDLSDSAQFSYEKILDDDAKEVITCKILGYDAERPAEIGDVTKVKVKTNFGVEAVGILAWLKLFGTVTGPHEFQVNQNTGLRNDVFVADIFLKKHIYEYLPMYGQKVQVHYPGIPRMCNKCYRVGHIRKECNNQKRDWVAFIIQITEVEGVKPELIGSWKNAIVRWKEANKEANQNPDANKKD